MTRTSSNAQRGLVLRDGQIGAVLLAALMVTGCTAVYLHNRPSPTAAPSSTASVDGGEARAAEVVAAADAAPHRAVPPPLVIQRRRAGTDPATGLRRVGLDEATLRQVEPMLGQAEARLIRVYQLIRAGNYQRALHQAERLARDYPNFHLAQLVLGDLLTLRARPVQRLGDVPGTQADAAAAQLEALREEARRRMRALTERPPEGYVPRQFLALSPHSRHAIAIDTSRSRLYLFENMAATRPGVPATSTGPQLRLIGDFYVSIGLQGIEKRVEGDQRTPLGVYYITSSLDPRQLPDLYGVGALPINYPNALDVRRGKTGSGIWLHGTPRDQFVRPPLASDGCVVLSNQDLKTLLRTVRIRTTPVVIAQQLQWVPPDSLDAERQHFTQVLESWRQARSAGDLQRLQSLYSERFFNGDKDAARRWRRLQAELRPGQPVQIQDASVLKWQDNEETMVVTFGVATSGQQRRVMRRQYWTRENGQWKIFYEGNA